jgi:hypothetical protein
MTAEEFDALFGADNISPDEQRIRGGAKEAVYVPGGRYESLAALKEHNESAYVGQIGGRRSRRRIKRRVNKKRRTVRRGAYRRRLDTA